MGRTERVLNAVVRTFLNIAMVVLAAMMLLTVADVTGRYLFNRPLTGSTEVTEFMMACLSFLAMAWCTKKKTHIKLDIMDRYLPPTVSGNFRYCFLSFRPGAVLINLLAKFLNGKVPSSWHVTTLQYSKSPIIPSTC